MRYLRFFGCSMILFACGGDSTNGDGGVDATANDAQANDAPANDTSANDVTPPNDGACVPADGGLACDPGKVTCGNTSCDLTKQFCCIDDAGTKQTCDNYPPDTGPPPPNGCNGTKVDCDEAADCPSGQVCCGFVGAGGGFATSCRQGGCGTGIQMCRSTNECASCVVQTCRGVTMETCGALCP